MGLQQQSGYCPEHGNIYKQDCKDTGSLSGSCSNNQVIVLYISMQDVKGTESLQGSRRFHHLHIVLVGAIFAQCTRIWDLYLFCRHYRVIIVYVNVSTQD